MAKWTIDSDRPPAPDDGPFYGADLNLYMHADAWVSVAPKTTKQFDQAALKNPTLKEELKRLCQSFPPEHLSALADALRPSAKGAIKRGPREKALESAVVTTIKAMLQAGKKPGEIAKAIAPQIPSLSPEGQLKRARREVKRWSGYKPGFQVSHQIALQRWAVHQAAGQLEEEVTRGTLTEAEAMDQLLGRVSAIMSRASAP
jgi:hypothetical protein